MDLRGRVEAIRKAARMVEPAGPPPHPPAQRPAPNEPFGYYFASQKHREYWMN